ncbi:DHA2 family efflux MFS transporter permease subunit [Lentzea sp. BCCO 10_0061]|uniref:DHA2 family efflux MFS transporter permease subunit n=1 Tax=Lentzea sokolovensis TaxID=3095429 RepID=A0ABU4V3V1_9PSEU|nr:DHA2 family efflux MFS transporter permease subunit [Lentzea sp. BCCO 10_0061]MDX8146369.1 DHA2 family efflux MFS transporter permease subunit [Lentzea sp. BCCO 10_0061]
MTSTNTNPDLESPPATAAAQAAEVVDAPSAADPRRWIAFIIMTVATFMDMLDGSIVNVALPAIQHGMGASFVQLQWITAGYVFAFALTLITGGRLGDIYGRRRMFQLGVLGFVVTSFLCGIAVNPEMLVISRLAQGLAAGLMVPQVMSIIHVTFPDKEKGAVFAIQGTIGGLAATIAPLVGGVLVAANIFNWEWRTIFLVNVPIGLIGYVLGWKYINESKAPSRIRLDLIGVVIATVSLTALLFPLTFGRELHWPAWGFVLMAASVVGFIGFVAYERAKQRKDGMPLVPLSLFKSRSFSAALALMLGMFSFTGMFMLALYLYLQEGLGFSPLRTGVTLLAFCIGAFITASASVIALVPKFGRAVLQVGAVVIAVGVAVLLFSVSPDITSWGLVPGLLLIGLGFGMTATPIALFALQEVPHEDAGAASGLINTKQQLGFAVGISVVTLAFFAPLASHGATNAESLAPQVRQELVTAGVADAKATELAGAFQTCAATTFSGTPDAAACGAVQADPQAKAIADKYSHQAAGQSFTDAFRTTLYVGFGFAALALLLASFLPRWLKQEEWGAPAEEGAEEGSEETAKA